VIRLDQLRELRVVHDTMYIGFNEGIESLSFPALERVEGALIIEHNPHLVQVDMPALVHISKYLHVHDNEQLTHLSLPSLCEVGDVSVLRNHAQLRASIASAAKPMNATLVEMDVSMALVFATTRS
jgi:hypothetical protein